MIFHCCKIYILVSELQKNVIIIDTHISHFFFQRDLSSSVSAISFRSDGFTSKVAFILWYKVEAKV